MIKIDLITGFLGAGKTTFIKKYATYLLQQGMNIHGSKIVLKDSDVLSFGNEIFCIFFQKGCFSSS